MYKLMTKNGQLFAFGLGALIVAITLVFIFTGIGDDFSSLDPEVQAESTAFNFGLVICAVLVGLCVLLMFGFGLMHIFSDLKGSMTGLIGLGVVAVVFLVAKSMASTDMEGPISETIKSFGITEGVSQTISGALVTMFVLMAVAVLAFILSEIRNFFK